MGYEIDISLKNNESILHRERESWTAMENKKNISIIFEKAFCYIISCYKIRPANETKRRQRNF